MKFTVLYRRSGSSPEAQTFPARAMMWHEEANILTGTNFFFRDGYPYDANQNYIYTAIVDPSADGDSFSQSFMLKSGTYTFHVFGAGEINNGKLDWYVDNVLITSGQDWYDAGGATYNVRKTVNNVSVVGNGRHVLKGVVNGKNAGSIGYYMPLNKYWFEPSSDTTEV